MGQLSSDVRVGVTGFEVEFGAGVCVKFVVVGVVVVATQLVDRDAVSRILIHKNVNLERLILTLSIGTSLPELLNLPIATFPLLLSQF